MVVVFPTVTELLSIESEIVVVPLLITTTAGKCVVTPFESVTRTVRLYVPTGAVEATVIVSKFIVIPVTVAESEVRTTSQFHVELSPVPFKTEFGSRVPPTP